MSNFNWGIICDFGGRLEGHEMLKRYKRLDILHVKCQKKIIYILGQCYANVSKGGRCWHKNLTSQLCHWTGQWVYRSIPPSVLNFHTKKVLRIWLEFTKTTRSFNNHKINFHQCQHFSSWKMHKHNDVYFSTSL